MQGAFCRKGEDRMQFSFTTDHYNVLGEAQAPLSRESVRCTVEIERERIIITYPELEDEETGIYKEELIMAIQDIYEVWYDYRFGKGFFKWRASLTRKCTLHASSEERIERIINGCFLLRISDKATALAIVNALPIFAGVPVHIMEN